MNKALKRHKKKRFCDTPYFFPWFICRFMSDFKEGVYTDDVDKIIIKSSQERRAKRQDLR